MNFWCLLLASFCFSSALSQQYKNGLSVSMDQVQLDFSLDERGIPYYTARYDQELVVEPSQLGFLLKDSIKLDRNFQVLDIDTTTVDKTWKPVWGEESEIRNHYKQLIVHLKQKQSPGYLLDLVFRVFEDGIAFRYKFPLQPDLKHFVVSDEKTEFNLTGDHKTFWIPADFDSNEYTYTTSKLSEVDAWKDPILSFGTNAENRPYRNAVKTPLMLKSADDLYINIHEAALLHYPAMQLQVDREQYDLSALLTPDAVENKAYLRAPFKTPWRTLIISDEAEDILASKMVLNLNEPSEIENASWIKPMKYMGVWWEMQTGRSRWDYSNSLDTLTAEGELIPHHNHAANTVNVKKYIDFAAKHGIEGLLVEGWNVGWEEWLANQEKKFDFTTPYPDFDVEEIAAYAKKKGVKMIMHNETGASATSYDRQMDSAFDFMNKYDYPAVKTGYVGSIIPRGEHHDGQWMVDHFLRSIKTAADHKVMINIHEAVRPTGLHRTWPNFVTSEASRGNEWNAFSTGSPPEHETILPFTRLVGGPMDYTSGIFKMKGYAPAAPDRQMHSTLAKQLALYVTMYSPLQMVADIPEHYKPHMDAFQFIKDVPVDWDDTKIIAAEPGDYITIARKEKGRNNWFIGAITDENTRVATIPLGFLKEGIKYTATIYRDADHAHWKTNPEAYKIEKYIVDDSSELDVKLAEGGGAAISITPADPAALDEIEQYDNSND